MSPPGAVRHLLVRAPNWVGDLVMATPVLEAAVADPRFERVTVHVRAHLAPLLEGLAVAEHVEPLPRGADETARLRELAPDAALLLPNSLGAAWRAFRARVPVRAGTALRGRGALLTHRVVPPSRAGRRWPVPTAHLLRDVAGLLGIVPATLEPTLAVAPAAAASVREQVAGLGLDPGSGWIACCPGAAFGAAKLWPPARFAAALDALCAELGVPALVSGGPGEEALMDAVAGAARGPVHSLAGLERDLPRLVALVDGARLLLVGDSGPRWVAAARGVPCVSVMGPNEPQLTASSLGRARVVRLEGLECSPCLERRCPLGHHRCMTELPVRRVVDLARELLGGDAA